MRVRRLWVQNFRGIKSLDWKVSPDQRLIALIGPGDSGKSTILDAIHYLLGDRWSIPFSDADFYNVDLDHPVLIRALLVDVPPALKKDSAFGLWLSGVDAGGEPHQDPADGRDAALVVQLTVDSTLEPRWSVVRTDGSEQFLSASQRRAFSTFKVDDRTDAQLRWSRNSALGRMSASSGGEREALAAASRAAREALTGHDNSSLSELAGKVQERANKIGGGNFSAVRPGLDSSRSSMGAALALYEDVIPLTGYGLGSRRLASLAVQQLAAGPRSVAVVDELESGLEPHRAVRLLNYLLEDDGYSQVFVTTHSPVIVEAARIESLATVQAVAGVVRITSLSDADEVLLRLRRARPSSLLARKVVVTEGKTEHGLLLECFAAWDARRVAAGLSTSAGEGLAIQDGEGGTEAAPRTEALAGLGFNVAGFLDNDDRNIDGSVDAARAAGAQIIRWELGHNTETQVCAALEANDLTELIRAGVECRAGEDTVRQDLESVQPAVKLPSLVVSEWLATGITLEAARARVSAAAIRRKWFKNVDGGRVLGRWLDARYDAPQVAATVAHLEKVRAFVYAAVPTTDATSVAGEADE